MRFAVMGMGRAGQARVRDIQAHPQYSLLASVSRRPELGTHSWQQVLDNPDIETVIICRENAVHYELAKAALHHKKHVIVEFPLANHAGQIEELLQLAKTNQRILHCEFIGLLSASHLHRKQQLQTKPIASLQCRFQGGLYRWVAEEFAAGHCLQLATGRLHAIWDMVGPFVVEKASLQGLHDGYQLSLELNSQNASISLIECRYSGAKRQTQWSGAFADGTMLMAPPRAAPKGLFAADLEVFVQRLQGAPGYVADHTILAVAHLIDQHSQNLQAR